MTCPAAETLSAFTDGELPRLERSRVEQHLAECQACMEFVQELRSVDALGRSSLRAIPILGKVRLPLEAYSPARKISWGARVLAAAAVALLAWGLWHLDLGWRSSPQLPDTAHPLEEGREDQPKLERSAFGPPEFSDEIFERWAEPYRRLQIPLVPREEVTRYLDAAPSPRKPI